MKKLTALLVIMMLILAFSACEPIQIIYQVAPTSPPEALPEQSITPVPEVTLSPNEIPTPEVVPAPNETPNPVATPQPTVMPAGDCVYVTISVDGNIELLAQSMAVSESTTVDDVLEAVHEQYYSGGTAGFISGIDSMYNMYMISQFWGITGSPCVIVNGEPIGADMTKPSTADTFPAVAGDNIIISVATDSMKAPNPYVSMEIADGIVSAKLWTLDFMTFSWKYTPLANTEIIDANGNHLGTTDINGKAEIPFASVAIIEGLAAIPADGSAEVASSNREKISANELVAAFMDAGYWVETEPELDGMEKELKNLEEGMQLYFDKDISINDYDISESVYIVYLLMDSENSAVSVYNMAINELEEEYTFIETKTTGTNRALYVSEDGNQTEYGETYVLSMVENTLIIMYVDWDDYIDSGIKYTHDAQKILESLGY